MLVGVDLEVALVKSKQPNQFGSLVWFNLISCVVGKAFPGDVSKARDRKLETLELEISAVSKPQGGIQGRGVLEVAISEPASRTFLVSGTTVQ